MKISPLFTNGMVLQQGVSIPVSGEAAPEAAVILSFLGKTYRTRPGADRKWTILLDTQISGGPYTMEISASENGVSANEKTIEKIIDEKKIAKIIIEDIYIGDVWICSGQSNMEMPMQRLKDDFPEEWDSPVNSLIRQFKVPQEWDFSGPRRELSGGRWTAANAKTLDEFSGTAWFFAKSIFAKHNIPIGLINAAWGGTPAEAWMSREALAAFPAKITMGDRYADPAKRAGITETTAEAIKEWEINLAHEDAGLPKDWQNPKTDISGWDDITLPGDFAAVGLAQFCGVLWLAKDFEASESFAANDAKIWLGTITDADTVYVNGVEVGNTTYRYPPRKYHAGAGLLHSGKNRIVIRVICNNGSGGVTADKPFRVFTHNETIELAGTWKYKTGAAAPVSPEEFFFQRQPMGLFNAMIAPLLDYPCRGVLWYQGESNTSSPNEYSALFPALINDWRNKKRQADLPFLFVQLPIFGEPEENNETSPWAVIREAQRSALSLPATGMAAGLDLGEWNDLHPINKKDVGIRLALAAEKVVFKEQNTAPGPMLRSVRRHQGRLLINFDNRGKGLTARGKPYVSVTAGGKLFRLPADIESPECLSVDISAVKNPEKILYAWADNPADRQLYNSDGLPAIPFRAGISE